MTRSVTDAAILLNVIAGRDARDDITLVQPDPVPDYTKALDPHALNGARLGIPRSFQSEDDNITAAFDAAVEIIKGLGAEIGNARLHFSQYIQLTRHSLCIP